MSSLNFPRAAKSLASSKFTTTKTGVTIATPWGSFLDFDATPAEAAELAPFFERLAVAFRRISGEAPVAPVAAEAETPAVEAVESIEAAEAFPDVDPHVVALPKVKRAYTKRAKK